MILPFSFLLLSIGIYAGIIENFERSIIAKLIFVLFVLYDLAKHASASRRQRFLTVPAEEAILGGRAPVMPERMAAHAACSNGGRLS